MFAQQKFKKVIHEGFLYNYIRFIISVVLSCEEEEVAQSSVTARAQLIHNSADLAAQSVDIYLNNDLLLDNFSFRTASPFVDVPAGEEITIGVPSTSMSASQSIVSYSYNLTEDKKYVLIASRHISPFGYTPLKNFSIEVYDMEEKTLIMHQIQIYWFFTDLLMRQQLTSLKQVLVQEQL